MKQPQANINKFEEDPAPPAIKQQSETLLLNIDGYEGPIDVLLELARNQKVDLKQISILQLARQYLAFVEQARSKNLELAAEYLVMAAWLAYLKSRLLLPKNDEDQEPSAEEMAEALQFQLLRLEAMQNAAGKLQERPQLGQDIFKRGAPEGLSVATQTRWDISLFDLLHAYGGIRTRNDEQHYDLPEFHLMSTDIAMERLTKMLGNLPRKGINSVWTTLESFLPEKMDDPIYGRSSLASTLTASLELAKQGFLEIKQDGTYRPIYMRALDVDTLENQDIKQDEQ